MRVIPRLEPDPIGSDDAREIRGISGRPRCRIDVNSLSQFGERQLWVAIAAGTPTQREQT